MSESQSQPQENGEFMRRTDEAVWNEGNLDLIAERFAEDFLLHDPAAPDEYNGPNGYREYVSLYRTALPDIEKVYEAVIAQNEFVVVRWRARGTNDGEFMGMEPTHREVELTGTTVNRIENGQVAEAWEQYDALGLMRQLGVVPDPPQN